MAQHASESSVEDRIKRNVYNIQRTSAQLDKNFARHWLSCLCVTILFMFPWAVESSPLQFFGASVINLNEPPRALATSTILWGRIHPFWADVNKSNAG